MKTSSYRYPITVLVGFLSAELIILPIRSAAADDTSPIEAPVEAGFTEQGPTLQTPSKPGKPAKLLEDVSNTGALRTSLTIEVPPGRNGAAPKVTLSYSSDHAQHASAFGAGWSAPLSSISRSTRHGTPRIIQVADGPARAYDNDPSHALFERDGVELAADVTAPVREDTIYFRDHLDLSKERTVFYPKSPSYWIVTEKNGTQHFYGRVPNDSSVLPAVVSDDLGVSRWLLVRTMDNFGNAIDYEYVHPTQTDQSEVIPASDFQLEPLPLFIRYGKNVLVGYDHFAKVVFNYTPVSVQTFSYSAGHTFLNRIATTIEIFSTAVGTDPFRTYHLTVEKSSSSPRYLLIQFYESTSEGIIGPMTSFEYSRNDGIAGTICTGMTCPVSTTSLSPSSAISASIDRNVFRSNFQAGVARLAFKIPLDDLFGLPDPDGRKRWPTQYLLQPEEQRFFSAAGSAGGFTFRDLDGDGGTDILYLPNFVSGWGLPQPWMTFLRKGVDTAGNPQYESYFTGQRATDFASGTDPLSMTQGASDYVDVDKDGVVDRVALVPVQSTDAGDPVGQASLLPQVDRPQFDYGNPDCVKWAALGPRVYPIPSIALPESLRNLVGITSLMSAAPTARQAARAAAAPTTNLCAPVAPPEVAQAAVAADLAPFDPPAVLSYETQHIEALSNLPPSLEIAAFPTAFQPLPKFGPVASQPALCDPHGPIGPLTPQQIATDAIVVTPGGQLAANMDKISSGITSVMQQFGLTMPTPGEAGIVGGLPGTYGEPCPIGNISPRNPERKPIKICVGPICLDTCTPPNCPEIKQGPKPFNINDFDPSICFSGGFTIPNPERHIPQFEITRGSLRNGPRTSTSVYLADFPFNEGPTYFVDYRNPELPGIPLPDKIKSVRPDSNVYMPLVDLDRDGIPEAIALKANHAHRDKIYADLAMSAAVWRIADYRPLSESSYRVIQDTRFADSLKTIMHSKHPTLRLNCTTISLSPDLSCEHGFSGGCLANPEIDSQRLLPIADWVTTFLDVNSDGLPDLVMAKGASCYHKANTALTDHKAGFDIFLNRGDRFETTAYAGGLSHGPFEMVRNWTSGHLESPTIPSNDRRRFPFAALSFTDLDADGVQDAVLSVRVGWDVEMDENEGPGNWAKDPAACASDLGTLHNSAPFQPDPNIPTIRQSLNTSMVRCVWRGTGTGWTGAKDLAERLPPNTSNGMHAFAVWIKSSDGIGRFSETYTLSDLSRFADLNGDGVADLLTIGRSDRPPLPDEDPHRVLVNTSQRPDLLQGIDNGLGARSQIHYRPARLSELTHVASIPWVVDKIVKETKVGASSSGGVGEAEARDETTLTYEGGQYDFFDQDFLGFSAINGTRPVLNDEGVTIGTQLERNVFYQDEQSSGTVARNPLKGLLKGSELRDAAGNLEVFRTFASYEVVQPATGSNVWRVRQTEAVEDGCASLSCPATAAHIVRTTTWSDFDEFDNPKSEVLTAVRSQVGDQLDSTITLKQARTYLNDVPNWIIGLTSTYKRTYATPTGDVTLASESYTYRTDKLDTKTTVRIGVEGICEEGPNDYVERNIYNNDGTLQESTDNNNVIVGAAARTYQTFAYDLNTHTLPIEIRQHHVAGNQVNDLTTTHVYDHRFGVPTFTTDPNGHTTQILFDGLGRPGIEVSAEGTLFRDRFYDWNSRPIAETTNTYPGGPSAPPITETRYLDGKHRELQSTLDEIETGKTIVTAWKRYDTLGGVSRSAVPFQIDSKEFVVTGGIPLATNKVRSDAIGRPARYELPDGRSASIAHAVGMVTTVDFRGTPHWTHTDALGRSVRSEEAFRKHDVTGPFDPGTYTTIRTSATRDGDGKILTVTDSEGRTRSFRHDHNDKLTGAGTATGDYQYCYDGHGNETRRRTPEGRVVKSQYDDLGRIASKVHLPAAVYGSADINYDYDNSQVANSRGRLTAIREVGADLNVGAYDIRGNVTMRTHVSHLGAASSPWADGHWFSSATYDLLSRATAEYLPIDPTLMNEDATTQIEYDYDSRGQLRKLRSNGRDLLNVTELLPSGKVKKVLYADGSNDVWTFEPLNERMRTVTTSLAAQTLLAYDFQYDENNNPIHVGRSMSDGSTSRTLTKTQAYDTIDRLESSTYHGTAGINQQYDFVYSNSGNILNKDGLTYKYEGPEPQAVSRRVSSSGGATENYGYDADGQLTSASPDHDGRSLVLTWNGDGQLATMASDGGAPGSTTIAFTYGPEGGRLAKRVTIAGSAGGAVSKSYSDLYFGALELRGSDAVDGTAAGAYYNLDLGKVHAQIALRRDANGRLSRDASADRYFHLDHLGSTALVTAGDGMTVSSEAAHGQLEYAPYGESILSDAGTTRIKRRFTGKEQDELGLTYFGARYVDPKLGRWTSRDPSALRKPEIGLIGSQQANLFAFADNNPARNIDPDGQMTDVAATVMEFAHQTADKGRQGGPLLMPVVIAAMVVYVGVKVYEMATAVPQPTTATPSIPGTNAPAASGAASAPAPLQETSAAPPVAPVIPGTPPVFPQADNNSDKLSKVVEAAGTAAGAIREKDKPAPLEMSRGREKEKAAANTDKKEKEVAGGHDKGARQSTKEKHEKGDERRGRDQGGEKGDARRPYQR